MKNKNKVVKPGPSATGIDSSHDDYKYTILLIGILLFTLLLFFKVLRFEFTNWDDPEYIVNNDIIRDFSPKGLIKIITTPVLGMYNPLPFLLYALTYHLIGLNPTGFHLINLVLHLIAILVTYNFCIKLTNSRIRSLLIVLIFAIHPLHVSVVVWLSQTKTSLFYIFYLLGLTKYIQFIQSKDTTKYKSLAWSFLLLILSVLSKPSAITFTPIMFLLDYYFNYPFNKRTLLNKIPFIIVSVLFGLMTLFTHSQVNDNIFRIIHSYSPMNYILIGNYAIVFYIEKFFLPFNLSSIYPYPPNDAILNLRYYVALPVLPLILFTIFKFKSLRKELLFGFGFFFIAVMIVLRIVPSGTFSFANRYSYLSSFGLTFIIVEFIMHIHNLKYFNSKQISKFIFLFLISFFVLLTWRTSNRIDRWKNSITLFSDVIKKYPLYPMPYEQRGLAKLSKGDAIGALKDLERSIAIDPNYETGYINHGSILLQLNKPNEALADFNSSLRINSRNHLAYSNRAIAYLMLDSVAQAEIDVNKSLSIDTTLNVTYFVKGFVELSKGDSSMAMNFIQKSFLKGFKPAEVYLKNPIFTKFLVNN